MHVLLALATSTVYGFQVSGGFTSGGFTSGGFTSGGFTSGGFTSGGFTSGGFTSGGFTGRYSEAFMKTLTLPWTTVYATSDAPTVLPAAGWMRGADWEKVRGTLEIRGSTGDIEVEIALQVADVENSPNGTLLSVTGYKTTDDVHYPTAFVGAGATVDSKQLVRRVYRVKNNSTSALNVARVGGSIDVILKG